MTFNATALAAVSSKDSANATALATTSSRDSANASRCSLVRDSAKPRMSYFTEGEWQEHYLNALRHSRPEPSPYLYKDYKREVKGQLTPFQRAKLTEFLPSLHKTVSTVLILGAGGVTSWLIPQLIKTLYASRKARGGDDAINIYLIDGDTVDANGCV